MKHLGLVSLFAIVGMTALAREAAALNVVLTNDDGWQAPGIQAMKRALENAGHTVVLAAPLTDQSGTGASIDRVALKITRQSDHEYSVAVLSDGSSAKPASSGYIGISIMREMGREPDLLISGINSSANIGLELPLSGTAGAANHAVVSVLNGPVSAIAVGTEQPCGELACQVAHYEKVADFVLRFVDHLQTKPGFLSREARLLPPGVALIISHPASDEVKGIRIGVQADAVLVNGAKVAGMYVCISGKCSTVDVGKFRIGGLQMGPDTSPDIKNADAAYFLEGYVTIVPTTPDYTVENPLVFKSVLSGFVP